MISLSVSVSVRLPPPLSVSVSRPSSFFLPWLALAMAVELEKTATQSFGWKNSLFWFATV